MLIGKAVAKRIDELLFKKGWSLYRLAKDSCLPLSTLKNLYTGHTKSPTLSIIFKISASFDMTPLQFLDSPIFSDEDLELD